MKLKSHQVAALPTSLPQLTCWYSSVRTVVFRGEWTVFPVFCESSKGKVFFQRHLWHFNSFTQPGWDNIYCSYIGVHVICRNIPNSMSERKVSFGGNVLCGRIMGLTVPSDVTIHLSILGTYFLPDRPWLHLAQQVLRMTKEVDFLFFLFSKSVFWSVAWLAGCA